MLTAAFAGPGGGITVLTFGAMYATVQFLAAYAKAAIVAKSAHTAFAEPALAAKGFFIRKVTIVTAQTMPAVVYVAILAGHTITAPYRIRKAFATFVTVRCDKTACIGTLCAAIAAGSAHILIPMVMAAAFAVPSVLPIREGGGHQPQQQRCHQKHTDQPFC